MANGLYNQFLVELMKGLIDLDSHTLKIALLDANHSFLATAEGWAAISGNEVEGEGYTAGGQALASRTVTYSDGKCIFDAADLAWENSTIEASHAVLYDDTHAGKCLIASWDLPGAPLSSYNGTFALTLDTLGAVYLA